MEKSRATIPFLPVTLKSVFETQSTQTRVVKANCSLRKMWPSIDKFSYKWENNTWRNTISIHTCYTFWLLRQCIVLKKYRVPVSFLFFHIAQENKWEKPKNKPYGQKARQNVVFTHLSQLDNKGWLYFPRRKNDSRENLAIGRTPGGDLCCPFGLNFIGTSCPGSYTQCIMGKTDARDNIMWRSPLVFFLLCLMVRSRVDTKWRFQFFAKNDYCFLLDVIIAIIATFFAKAIIAILRLLLSISHEW